jgi:hypothetical protein
MWLGIDKEELIYLTLTLSLHKKHGKLGLKTENKGPFAVSEYFARIHVK